MRETAANSVCPDDASLAMPSSPLTPPPYRPGRFARILRACFTLPRLVIRQPLKSLLALALLLLIGGGCGIAGMWLRASFHLRAGRTALERYHTAEALPHLQIALSQWPNDPETVLLAIRAARRSGVFTDAYRLLERCRQQHYTDENIALERALVRAESGEPDSVSAYCRTFRERNPSAAPLIYEALAQGYLRNYQPRKAEASLQEWFRLEPANPQAFVILGRIQELEMRHSAALQSYRAALTADSAFDEARLYLCDTLMQLGLLDEAQPHLEYLRPRLPNKWKVQVYLARVYDSHGNPQEAERILDDVLARRADFAPALAERGKLAERAGQVVEAEKWLRQAVARDPGDVSARYHLASCLQKNGKSEEADKEQEQLHRLEEDIEKLQNLVVGKLEQMPNNADLHFQVGVLSLHVGAVDDGLRWLHRSLQEDPKHRGAHQALMEYYQRIGDFDRAGEHREKWTATKASRTGGQ